MPRAEEQVRPHGFGDSSSLRKRGQRIRMLMSVQCSMPACVSFLNRKSKMFERSCQVAFLIGTLKSSSIHAIRKSVRWSDKPDGLAEFSHLRGYPAGGREGNLTGDCTETRCFFLQN